MNNEFSCQGAVLGNFWGGGIGSYPARELTAETREDLIEKINAGIKDGSLDSGMGFQSLKGAYLMIKKREYLIVDDKLFHSDSYEEEFYGELTDEEENFLQDTTRFVIH